MRRRIEAGWMIAFAAATAGIALTVLLGGTYISQHVRAFAWPQGAMMAAGVAAMLLPAFAMMKTSAKRRCLPLRLMPWAALFVAQAAASYFAYFMAGWDVHTVLTTAYAIAGGDAQIDQYYFSLYPNNAAMAMIFAAVMRAFRTIAPGAGLDRCALILILMQCALNACAGMLAARVAGKWLRDARFARFTGLVYAAICGISPWVMVPYSDSMGLIFPVLLCALYQAQWEAKRPALVWLGTGAVSALGYLIKPQTVIVLIAIVLTEAFFLLRGRGLRALMTRMACALVTLGVLLGPVWSSVKARLPFEFREGYGMTVLHFAMMGMNEQTAGCYSAEDIALSLSTLDEAEKRSLQLEEIGKRLDEMGAAGIARHIARKTLINYGDGMMGWGGEGNFVREQIADKHPAISPKLKSFITPGTRENGALAIGMQAIWLAMLCGLPLCAAAYRRMRNDEPQAGMMLMMTLAVAGLTLFEWIFEARARYLFTFLPVYALLGACGIWHLAACIAGRLGKGQT